MRTFAACATTSSKSVSGGKAEPKEIVVVHKIDKASPVLL